MAATPVESSGIGYFVQGTSIERYAIEEERWLAPVSLASASETPSAIHVDTDGIYVAFGRAVYRYDTDGASRVHLLNTSSNVIAIHSDENLLFFNSSAGLYSDLVSINKSTNAVISTSSVYIDSLAGSSIAPSINRIFGRSVGLSPADLTFASYSDTGLFETTGNSPYHGNYADALKTWVFDDERYVVDDSGNVYATSSFLHSGRLGSNITDIDFLDGSIPIVLDGTTLTSYSTSFLPDGVVELDVAGDDIFVNERSVLVFRQAPEESHGYAVTIVSLSDLNPSQPGDVVDPVGLAYTPDNSFVASDGTVLLLSKSHQSIFRWDPETESYSQSIRLLGAPEYVAYSAKTNVLYTSYPDGLIRQIDLSSPEIVEKPFYQLPAAPMAIVTSGSFVIAQDVSGAWSTLNSISADGVLVDSQTWQYPSAGMIWNDTNQSVYYFSTFSPSDLHTRKINIERSDSSLVLGGIGPDRDTPLHGSSLIMSPVSISPDGKLAVLGSGAVFDAVAMTVKNAGLSNSVSDIAWLDNQLYTVRNIANVVQVQKWIGETFAEDRVRQFSNTASRLFAVRPNVLLLISQDTLGKPVFQLLNADLEDAAIDGSSVQTPTVQWTPPAEMLSIDRLNASILNATADVPGTMTYSPEIGTQLNVGRQTLSVTFTPTDTVKYRAVTRAASILVRGVDFGDALKPTGSPGSDYPVTLAQDGARHVIDDTLYLGAGVDDELDGSPATTNTEGDNATGGDEDGVRFSSTIFSLPSRSASSLAITASNAAFVSAWIDFNGDGDWNDANENVVVDHAVDRGTNVVAFEVPPHSYIGSVAARIRISSQTGLQPIGLAVDGEVEDYMLQIRAAGEPIEINPVSTGTLSIEILVSNEFVYTQGGSVLARYPMSVVGNRIWAHEGQDTDETIEIPPAFTGKLLLMGDGKGGKDRILLGENQHLDLTQQLNESIRNIESIDLRGSGLNQLKLNDKAVRSMTDELSSLEIYHDSVDQVLFEGSWTVSKRTATDGETQLIVSSDEVVVNLFNDRLQHNPVHAHDVNGDGLITPLDALLVINQLSNRSRVNSRSNFADVSGDGVVAPWDALLVINHLSRRAASGEGEASAQTNNHFSLLFDAEADRRRARRS